jgi:hypothetical protein
MTKLKVLLFISLFAFGCNYSGSQKDTKTKSVSTDQLISENKDRLLFLSFWDGMNEQEFNQIKNFENEKGDLKDGKFLLMTSSSNGIPFEVTSNEHSVTLTYEDTQWASYTGNAFYAANEIPDGHSYSYIENYIEKLFNEKYERISPVLAKKKIVEEPKDGKISLEYMEQEFGQVHGKEHKVSIEWKSYDIEEPRKLITLYSSYSFLDKNYDKHSSSSGATSKFYHDRENKKAKIGECFIQITYEFYDEHLEREKEQELREIELRKKREQEMKEVKNRIQKNNNNL